MIPGSQLDRIDPHSIPSHGAHVLLGEAQRLPLLCDHDQLLITRRPSHPAQFVTFLQADGDQAAGTHALEFAQARALDPPVAREHGQIAFLLEIGDCDGGRDLLIGVESDDAHQKITVGRAARAGNLIGAFLINLPLVAEEENGIQRIGREEMEHFILLVSAHADHATPAASLRAVDVHRHALDVAALRDGDQHLLLRHQILLVQLSVALDDVRAALIPIRLLHLQ